MPVTTWGQLRRANVEVLQRESAARRGYDRAWQRTRLRVLSQRPLCEDCAAEGIVEPATEVHHVVKIRVAPELRNDANNLRALCAECHAARTAAGE